MAHKKSSKKSSRRPRGESPLKKARAAEDDFLEFPEGWRFMYCSPRIGLDAMIRFSAENLARFNARPGAEEERLRDKCNVPFEL